MHVWTWILCGLVAGSLARTLTGGPRWGLTGDLALGTLGGALGGWLFQVVGIVTPAHGLAQVVVATAGAATAIGAMRAIDRLFGSAATMSHRHAVATVAPTLEAYVERLGEIERRVLARILGRERVARDPNVTFEEQLTIGERAADRLARFGGSWPFLGLFAAILFAWMTYNKEAPRPFDPYPFILLNLVLSCLAAIQAPVIMMSQNRLAAKDRLDAHHDYEVNLKAELEIMQLHAKLDELLARESRDLAAILERQLETLARIEGHLSRRGPG
jgi:uncharacterized membrane protein/uncharacterized membrane protein YeaQ/YmgE (transglycosylase-associated protein family)